MTHGVRALIFVLLAHAPAALAAPPDSNDPVYAELLKVRTGLVDAYNRKDLDGVLRLCHPQIVVTWQNGEVSEGRDGVKRYYEKMMVGPQRIVETMTADPTVDNLAVIYGGDTAVSRGQMNDHYQLTDGMRFDLNSRWSATLVKDGGEWLIANFHASVNAFDNPLLRMIAKQASLWSGSIGALIGIVLGLVATRWFARHRRTTTA